MIYPTGAPSPAPAPRIQPPAPTPLTKVGHPRCLGRRIQPARPQQRHGAGGAQDGALARHVGPRQKRHALQAQRVVHSLGVPAVQPVGPAAAWWQGGGSGNGTGSGGISSLRAPLRHWGSTMQVPTQAYHMFSTTNSCCLPASSTPWPCSTAAANSWVGSCHPLLQHATGRAGFSRSVCSREV